MARLVPLSLLALCALAAPAQAAYVKVEPTQQRLRFVAAPGEANRLAITVEDQTITFVESGAAGTVTNATRSDDLAGPGWSCSKPASTTVACTVTGAWELRADLGDGDDTAVVTSGTLGAKVDGGTGNDALIGGEGVDHLIGGDGEDELDGRGGADKADAGAGDDVLKVRDGLRDQSACGLGADAVEADVEDAVDADCETVDRPLVPPAVPDTPKPEHPAQSNRPQTPAPPQPVPSAPPADDSVPPVAEAEPEAGRTVAAGVKRGSVRVKTDAGFAPLDGAAAVPVGATVDARSGVVRLTSASNLKGRTQTAEFTGGVFRVGQQRGKAMTTVLTLTGELDCATRGRARAAAKQRRPRTRRLWGSGHGRFTTKGRNSQATVRGTIWSVEDRCDGTVTRVERGVVAVDDCAPAGARSCAPGAGTWRETGRTASGKPGGRLVFPPPGR